MTISPDARVQFLSLITSSDPEEASTRRQAWQLLIESDFFIRGIVEKSFLDKQQQVLTEVLDGSRHTDTAEAFIFTPTYSINSGALLRNLEIPEDQSPLAQSYLQRMLQDLQVRE